MNRDQSQRRKLQVESLERREVLSSVGWDGPGRGSAELSYYIGEVPDYLDPIDVEGSIESALDAWSDVANIEFTQTDRPNLRNSLDIEFENIDGKGGTLAQAYLPGDVNRSRIAGDITFDTSERWEIGNAQGRRAFDLTLVAVHEIGHALGLEHSHSHSDVMASSVSASQQFTGLSDDDVEHILELYAAAPLDPIGGPGNGTIATNNPIPTFPDTDLAPAVPDLPTAPNDGSDETPTRPDDQDTSPDTDRVPWRNPGFNRWTFYVNWSWSRRARWSSPWTSVSFAPRFTPTVVVSFGNTMQFGTWRFDVHLSRWAV